MKPNNSNRNIKDYRKNFIVLPVVFLFCGYLLLYLAISPVIEPLMSAYRLAFTGNTITNGTEIPSDDSIFFGDTGVYSGIIKASGFEYPTYGSHFANITVDGTKINAPVYFGDDNDLLKKGACLSFYTSVPGYGKLVMISAHNYTFFRDLQPSAKIGGLVHIETNYGSYVYKIFNMKLTSKDDSSAYTSYFEKDEEYLILYSCQMENGISMSENRYYVYCEFVSGPKIDKYS